jgi:hypothetical protein
MNHAGDAEQRAAMRERVRVPMEEVAGKPTERSVAE